MLLWGYSAFWGLKLALKHVDYQVNPSPFNVCEGFVDFPSWAPLDKWVPWLFFPDGDCSEISWQFLGFSMPQWLVAIFAAYLLVFVVVNVLAHWRRGTATPLGLVAAFSNNVLVGIPLIASLMGNDGLLYVFAILVFHSLTLFSLHSFYAAFGSQERVDGRALLKNLANPMIIGLGLGALLNLSGLQLPDSLWRAITWLGQAALPCALIVLGASLSRYRLRPTGEAWGVALAKLLLFPALVWWLSGQLPGLNETARSVLVLLAACPSGVNVMAFARNAEDSRSVSAAISLSTLLAAVSLPLWMLLVGF